MAEWLLAIGFVLLLYTYLGYPALMWLLSKIVPRPIRQEDITPTVTIIIAAYNEEAAIGRKVEDTLALDYPRDRLEIIVASDGSTDRTDEIVLGYAERGVLLKRVEGRRGKTAAQNETVNTATGEILVFTDATTVLEREAIRRMVRVFADPAVGCASGHLNYVSSGDGVGRGGVAYWHYERALKRWESRASSLIGVSGCFYAIRKSLYRDIPPHLISDFVVALNTRERDYRVVYAEDAVCYEETLTTSAREFNMRVRVAIRSYAALWEKRALLNPFRYPLYSLQLFSHKVLRYLAPLMLLDVWVANVFLLGNPAARLLFVAQCSFYGLALVGHWLTGRQARGGLIVKPYYFCLANAAALVALLRFLAGERMVVWKPLR